jgi:hypothetical protein
METDDETRSTYRVFILCTLRKKLVTVHFHIRGRIQSFGTGRLEQQLQMVELCATRCILIAIS